MDDVGPACPAPEDHARVGDLEHALASNRLIGAAVGIIMARHLLSYEQAFEALRTASARLNRRVSELASETVETGLAPSTLTAGGNSRRYGSRVPDRRRRRDNRGGVGVEAERGRPTA